MSFAVDSLFIVAPIVCVFCVCSWFCCAVHNLISSFAIIQLVEERTGYLKIALLCHLTVSALCHFLMVQRVISVCVCGISW